MTLRIPLSVHQTTLNEGEQLRREVQKRRSYDTGDASQVRRAAAIDDGSDAEEIGPGSPGFQELLEALNDSDCRTIIQLLEQPLVAAELDDMTEIPRSTLYRKLNLLSDAGLIKEDIEISQNRGPRTRFKLAFDEVRIVLDEKRSLKAELGNRSKAPDERLAEMWSEVSR